MTTMPDYPPDDLHTPTVAPEFTHDELLAFRTEWGDVGHDFDAPESGYARAVVALDAVELQRTICPHCRPAARPRPLRGTGWGIEWFHADGCPGVDE